MEDTVRVYIKGAPENIIENCAAYIDSAENKKQFD